jgi:mannosyltransferase OCH1-like enzyme
MIIPKLIHQIWIGESPVPYHFNQLMNSWEKKNQDWEYKLWGTNETRDFLEEYYIELLPFFEKLSHTVQKVDLLRYLILIKHGGLYVDVDYDCISSVNSILENKNIAFGLEPIEYAKFHKSDYFLGTCFIASVPQHPFLIELVAYINNRISLTKLDNIDRYTYVMNTTGPKVLNEFYHKYSQNGSISLINAEYVCPLDLREVKEYYLGINKRAYAKKLAKAVAIHLFSGTWL